MLKMNVMGEIKQLALFMNHFQSQEYYNIKSESYHHRSNKEGEFQEVCVFFQFQSALLKPTIRSTFWVHLKTQNGHKIKFPLLDGKITKMDDGSVVVTGKNYDIFSNNKTIDDE